MLTMKKTTTHATMVVRVPNDRIGEYIADDWVPCPRKAWRRSGWAMRKDMSGPSSRVKVDPVPDRIEKRSKLSATHIHWRVKKAKRRAKKVTSEAFDSLIMKMGLGGLLKKQ